MAICIAHRWGIAGVYSDWIAYFSTYSDYLVLISYQLSNNLNITLHFLNMLHDVYHLVLPRAGEIVSLPLFYRQGN